MSGWDSVRSSTRSQQGRSQNLSQRAPSRTVTLGRVQPQAPAFRTIYCNDRDANYAHRYRENVFWVIYVLMSTFYFYITLLLVPVAALLGDFLYLGVQRWFFPYDYQVVQEIHKDEADDTGRSDLLGIEYQLTPDEARSYAISQLPGEISKHSGFAFGSPGYESFFASQLGIYAPQKAWDVARRASMRSKPKTNKKK